MTMPMPHDPYSVHRVIERYAARFGSEINHPATRNATWHAASEGRRSCHFGRRIIVFQL